MPLSLSRRWEPLSLRSPGGEPTARRTAAHTILALAMILLLSTLGSTAVAAGSDVGQDAAPGPARADTLHARYDELLQRYVRGSGVDYAAWVAQKDDVAALDHYVEGLAALDPESWPPADGLAFWINLYNALTVQLILENYPLASIKDLGGVLRRSPWKRELVQVAGRPLTLDAIENEIIRPRFAEPRIHFALNCASIGCPPLADSAYRAATLEAQLDAACRRALNEDRWVRVDDDGIRLSKIFDWYRGDFEANGGSIRAFVDRFRSTPLPDGSIDFLDYDWSLNEAP